MKKIKIQNNIKTKAFTLIEALVAVSILMIAIASPMTLAQKGLSTATLSKDQMIASFLAQDAIEAVKNIRDQVAIRGNDTDWLDSRASSLLHNCMCNPVGGDLCDFNIPSPDQITFCRIDTTAPSWDASSILTGSRASPSIGISYNVDTDNRKTFLKYDYNTLTSCTTPPATGPCGEQSKFSRYINIIRNPAGSNPNEAVVNVRVFWESNLGEQKIDVQDYIYNYSENL